MESTSSTPTQYKQVTVEVPEDRLAEFHAFFGRFLARFGGPERRGRHGRHHHGRHSGCGRGRRAGEWQASESQETEAQETPAQPAGSTAL